MASQNACCFLRSFKNVPQTTDLPHGKHLVMWFIVNSFYPINLSSIDNTIYFLYYQWSNNVMLNGEEELTWTQLFEHWLVLTQG